MEKRVITEKDVTNLTHMGWTSSIDHWMGTVEWSNPKTTTMIYATPNWENEDNQTPFSIYKDDGDVYNVLMLTSYDKDSIETQVKIYLECLSIVIKSL